MLTRNEMLEAISDLSKDAYGARIRLDYDAMSDDELRATWDSFLAESIASFEREKKDEARAQQDWETHLESLISAGAGDMATAIRWDMQAEDVGNDIGYYCYCKRISYSNEETIAHLLKIAA